MYVRDIGLMGSLGTPRVETQKTVAYTGTAGTVELSPKTAYRVRATTVCYYGLSESASTLVSGATDGEYLAANEKATFITDKNNVHLSVIQDASGGNIYAVELHREDETV